MSVGAGRRNIIIMFWKYQLHFWEYINGNQTLVLDSCRPFICSASDVFLDVQTVYRREAQAKVDRFEEEKENLARTALLNTIRSDNGFPVKGRITIKTTLKLK
jgi:hypothetical protein